LLANYGYVGLFLIIAIGFTILMVSIPIILRSLGVVPRKPSPVKYANFECGMETIGKSWVQFNFRYYFYALIFLALDVLIVFIYPWATAFRKLGVFSFIVIAIVIAIISIGYVYAWRKRVLEWK
jgi:NADH-quinone oxidoreductase subunit A